MGFLKQADYFGFSKAYEVREMANPNHGSLILEDIKDEVRALLRANHNIRVKLASIDARDTDGVAENRGNRLERKHENNSNEILRKRNEFARYGGTNIASFIERERQFLDQNYANQIVN